MARSAGVPHDRSNALAELLVSREAFLAAQSVSERRERSRSAAEPNPHPQTQRTHRLRNYVFCGACNRRMSGRAPRGRPYYVCRPTGIAPEGHPPGIWVPEPSLVAGVHAFFAERIFGPDRARLLAEQLQGSETAAASQCRAEMAALRRGLDDVTVRRRRLLRTLELTDDPDGELARDVGVRLAELRAEADDLSERRRALEESPHPAATPELLEALPVTGPDLDRVSDERARAMYEAFRLEITYDKPTHTARCRATLTADTLPTAIARAPGDDLATICDVPPTGFEPVLPP